MSKLIIQPPNPKQIQFFESRARHIAFGGARGGGKSWAVRTKSKLLALNYSGIKILIIRKSYPELLSNHINILRAELHGIARYNAQEKMFRFPNGSTITFGYCANDGDVERYQGAEYDVIFIDEACLLDELWIKKITACCRGVNDFPKRIYYTLNPGGRSHGYFKRLFIDKKYEPGEHAEDYVFIQSRVYDNKALMESQPDYIKSLENLPEKLRKAWLEGSFDIYEGQFFEEFTIGDEEQQTIREWTHVIKPFPIPAHWKRFRSYDFGYNKPFSCGWWVVDEDGIIYRVLELYGCTREANTGVKWTPDKQFEEIRKIEQQHPYLAGHEIIGVADPSIWDGSRGDSVADTAAKHQIYFSPGDNERINGWMQVRYRFQFDKNGRPRMYVFNNCEAFIRTMPLLVYSENKPEDLDTEQEDHVADEVRYFCMTRKVKSQLPPEEVTYKPFMDPLKQLEPHRRM